MSVKLGITGSDGLVGWHIRAWNRTYRPDIEVRLASRDAFSDLAALTAFARDVDAIVHCAGMNKGPDAEVEVVNKHLAQQLALACEAAAAGGSRYPRLAFTNTSHWERATGYGIGKRAAGDLLIALAERHGSTCANLILPHIFGEFGRPYANSVVSTFCYQLARGETPQIQVDGDLELVHAHSVAERCVRAALDGEHGTIRVTGEPLKVSALHRQLSDMADLYFDKNMVPSLSAPLVRDLFNTLRSYRFPEHAEIKVAQHNDPRGRLFESVRALNGGQTFFSTTLPGATRGNHFHTQKFERFLVCAGEGEIRLRRLFSNDVHVLKVSGSEPRAVDMPTFHPHSITNTGAGELLTLFWANEIFDPNRPDTFAEAVLP
jgi:UDP-2-acetamido-2,6-beta-L-arabino-hexul-4-ose reductase